MRRFFYGPGIDEPIAMQRVLGVYYYHYDGLGSVVALSDNSGNTVEKYSYDVYGKPTIRDSQSVRTPQEDAVRSTSAYYNRYMFTGRTVGSRSRQFHSRRRAYIARSDPARQSRTQGAGHYTGRSRISNGNHPTDC